MLGKSPPPPYPIWPGGSNYARRGVWCGPYLVPGVTLRTTARLRTTLARLRSRGLMLSVVQAACAALELHPRLNYFNLDGRLVWAGWPARVAVVLERPDHTCDLVVVAQAHRLDRRRLDRLLRPQPDPAPTGLWGRLRERLPRTCYWAERASGHLARRLVAHSAPLFVSLLGLPGIEELAFTPTHAMALYPAWPQEGRLPLTLCFSHQLANARPVARLLLTIRELLEH